MIQYVVSLKYSYSERKLSYDNCMHNMDNQNQPYDVVLVCKGQDFANMPIVVENICKYYNANSIYIVCPKSDILTHLESYANNKKLHFIDEDKLLPLAKVDYRHLNLTGFPNRFFWYYQQFLKIAFCCSNIPSSSHVLVWDADTIPLRPLDFFDNKKSLLTVSDDEYHAPYFETIKKLFSNSVAVQKSSFISQHMMVNRKHMHALLDDIEEISGKKWPEAIMKSLQGTSAALFSEYETYANYVLDKFPEHYSTRSLNWYRKGGYLLGYVPEGQLAKKFDFIAVEKFNNNKIKSMARSLAFQLFGWY